MDKDGADNLGDAHNVHSEIAEIEARADNLARQNETPQQVAEAQLEIKEQQELQKNESLALKNRSKFNLRLNKWAYIGIGIFIVLLTGVWFVPVTRYAILSTFGVRGGIVVTASQSLKQTNATAPEIKNFTVNVAGQTINSGEQSSVIIPSISLGDHKVEVLKQGYAPSVYETTVDFDPLFGWVSGNNSYTSLVKAQLLAKGLALSFTVKDWVSNKAVTIGEFAFGDITAFPNKDGVVSLTVPPELNKVIIKADFTDNYLDKTFELETNKKSQAVNFVPDSKHYFVSKRSGVYSIYSQYIDGGELKEVVKGTPQETSSLQFAVSPSGKYGVMTSTREGRRDSSGNVVQKLYWVNLNSGKLEELDSARYIYLHDWAGDTITYSYGYQAENSTDFMQRLRSLDASTKNQYELGSTTGSFGRIHVALNQVIFTKQESFNKPGFEKEQTVNTVGIKGENNRELATNTGDFRQIGFERFAYQTPDKKWSEINLNTGQIKPSEQPREEGTVYISTSSSNKERVFINFVDGKRLLMLQKNNDTTSELATQPGLTGPIRFMNATTVLYRVVTPGETADYVVSTLGGQPRKITDVTASAYATPVFFQYY